MNDPVYYQPAAPAINEAAGFSRELILTVGVGAIGAAIALLLLIGVLRSLLLIARPNQALVISGMSHRRADGTEMPYRILRQGESKFRIPVLHRVDKLDMRLIPIDILVQNAYSHGNIPLMIHAIANVKISNHDKHITNAVERFLGRGMNEVQTVAQQTLEGAVREVIATLTPEQINQDRLAFADKLSRAALDDFNKLGLMLDTLKIQNVSDATGYLDSLGRPRIAAALRDAENVESFMKQEIIRSQSEAAQRSNVAQAESETAILALQNDLRRIQAELDGHAQSVEREAEAAAKTARAEAERELQGLRANLEEKRLRAEVVIPAEIYRQAEGILAVGKAAPTFESGVAQAQVLELMSAAWREMGPDAQEIYVVQHLEEIVRTVVEQLRSVSVDEVNVIDSGDGEGMASYAATYPQMVSRVLQAVAETTGVDVSSLIRREGVV